MHDYVIFVIKLVPAMAGLMLLFVFVLICKNIYYPSLVMPSLPSLVLGILYAIIDI